MKQLINSSYLRNELALMTIGEIKFVAIAGQNLEIMLTAAGFHIVANAAHTPRQILENERSLRTAIDWISNLPILEEGAVYQHRGGGIYTITGFANEAATNPNYLVQVIYKGENGRVWTKTQEQFIETMKLKERALKISYQYGELSDLAKDTARLMAKGYDTAYIQLSHEEIEQELQAYFLFTQDGLIHTDKDNNQYD